MNISYLAGLMDGEGSIMLLGQGPNRCRRPVIAIGLTHRHVLEAVQETFGGHIKTHERKPPQQAMHTWEAKGALALALLNDMRPHLVMDRRKVLADLLINDPIICNPNRRDKLSHNQRVFGQMQALNRIRQDSVPKDAESPPSADDISYLAGVLDGEGYIGPRTVQVHSTDPELLSWLRSRFGGNVYQKRQRSNNKPIWAWHRAPTGFIWAARVADEMLLECKAETLRAMQNFKRIPPASRWSKPHAQDSEYLRLRQQGFNVNTAAKEGGIPVGRARYLEQ